MIDLDAPSTKLAIAEMQKNEERERIFKFAVWQCKRSEDDATDLLADALLLVYDPERKPWDPARCSFFSHMRVVMHALALDRARGGRARFEVQNADLAVTESIPSMAPPADEQLHDRRTLARLRKLGARLVASVEKKHPLAKQVFDLACEGVEKPGALAERIGCAVDEVYEATELLKYHAKRILAEDEEAEQKRMQEVRELAEKTETSL